MKHQSANPKYQDSNLDKDVLEKTTSKSKLRPACDPPHKPLTGRMFFLDLPSNKRTLTLEKDIKSLGGTVEKFFSKEIRYLVSGKPEARHVQRLVQDSPVPSPDSGLSSPHPGSKRDGLGPRGSSLGPADTVLVSRGKTLVKKVVKEQERVQINRILASALEWGVKIIYIDDIISYIEKKKSKLPKESRASHTAKKAAKLETSGGFQKCRAGRISRPFVKVEDSSRQYRPIYLPMATMPVCNFNSAAPCSPFLVGENCKGGKVKERGSCAQRRPRGRKERRRGHEDRRKGGYCECCMVKYEGLKAHLQSEQHLTFSTSEEYLVVDRVISGLTCDLIHIRTPVQRRKCSVSAPLRAPGVVMRRDGGERAVEREGGEVTDRSPVCLSPNAEVRSSGEPLAARKRCREPTQKSGEDPAVRPDVAERSCSKRRTFELSSSSKVALQKALGTSLSSTRPACFSDSLEEDSRPLQRNSSAHPTCQDFRTFESVGTGLNLRSACSLPGANTLQRAQNTNEASEHCDVSHTDFQTAQQTLLDIAECTQISTGRLLRDSGHGPVRTEQPADISHRPITAKQHSSSGECNSSCMDSPCRTLQRKVRVSRSRRRVSAEVPHVEASQSPRPLASDLDLSHFFKSSDSLGEDDFKGF
ncbi:protein DBF4 homolog A [Brachyhypopomus gauderio]|uniref:protein DBF4 homolog A n=1 Tax=Brachyhypopomus gauderio TaxID=698409 RepID=UPI0040419599